MLSRRSVTVYGLLAAAWLLIFTWQIFEHNGIKESAAAALLNRARDISSSVGVVIRSQRRFGGFISRPRLEAALEALTESNELKSVVLVNSAYEVAASAGEPIELDVENLAETETRWTRDTVTVVNLVDLGPGAEDGSGSRSPPIVVPGAEPIQPPGRRPDDARVRDLRSYVEGSTPLDERAMGILSSIIGERPLDDEKVEVLRSLKLGDVLDEEKFEAVRSAVRPRDPGDFRRGGRRGRGGSPFRRPPWMDTDRYQELIEKQGVHAFVLSMSTGAFHAECARDLWLRLALAGIALVAAVGLGVAWHNLDRSAALQIRLLRASELNLHLHEMNVAAAGLAHETRNPLNIIRGLAQMISQQADTPAEIRSRSREITEEVDRVTGRLNQFIDYSRPPEVRPAPTNLKAVIGDVACALESDTEDKSIEFEISGPELTVEADESLLRQVLFNLLLNSIQAVDHEGRIEVVLERTGPDEAGIEILDNGPGVPDGAREEIFRPYYTTSEQGTGLGLAVVRQIVLAHQWEIECVPVGADRGASFRITGLKVT